MVLHLDLKAENVLLKFDDDGEHFGIPRAILSDFGSSEARNRLNDRERTGCTGTLDYVAPEVLQVDPATGKLRELDASADLWSLGLLLVGNASFIPLRRRLIMHQASALFPLVALLDRRSG